MTIVHVLREPAKTESRTKMKIYICLLFVAINGCLATIPRPRGVAISMASFYQPGPTFTCLDGSKKVPFEYVNDDYCDCPDGTDEPGTSACPSGKFHCTNAGYKPTNILSSRVNDGICDCCDGTDEYNGNIECVNNCKELGKKMREESDRVRQLQEQGFKQKQQFSEEGKKKREEKQAQIAQLERNKAELEAVKNEMEAKKTTVEEPEKAAKDKHEQAWQEVLEQRRKEKEALDARSAFDELDENRDNHIDFNEIRKYSHFDIDSNGEVSEEEAKEHLEQEEQVDMDTFVEKIWPNIKDLYRKSNEGEEVKGDDENKETQPPVVDAFDREKRNKIEARRQEMLQRAKERREKHKSKLEDDYDDDDDDDDDDDEEEEDELVDDFDVPGIKQKGKFKNKPNVQAPVTEGVLTVQGEEATTDDTPTGEDEEKMPDYDDQTKALIAAADEARQQFNDAERKLQDTENEINNLNKYLNLDYGPNEEYSVLQGNCYEYTDREYTYKLCAYDRASQRSKSGGTETSLGSWGRWDGTTDDMYSAQKYDNGQNCWNGPNRSVKVQFKCGLENKLINAFEPSRCEYEFDFETPARCSAPSQATNPDYHDEL